MDNCKSKCFKKNTQGINPAYLNIEKKDFDFCYDNLLDEKSVKKCKENDYDIFFPVINFKENDILSLIYDIKNWNDSKNYFIKYKNITNKKTIERIITYSWISFFDTFKINIDNIILIYETYFKLINKNIDLNTIKDKIYELKKDNTKKEHFHKLILSNLVKK
jgi:hypothetical protein